MDFVREYGVVVYIFALLPVLALLVGIFRLQTAIRLGNDDRPKAVRRALALMPAILLAGPVFMFAMLNAENAINPNFAAQTFANPEAADRMGFFLFAIDQTLGGALFDSLEVFSFEISPLEHRCENRLFCISLFLYRLTLSLAVSALSLAFLAYVSNMCWQAFLSLLRPGAR